MLRGGRTATTAAAAAAVTVYNTIRCSYIGYTNQSLLHCIGAEERKAEAHMSGIFQNIELCGTAAAAVRRCAASKALMLASFLLLFLVLLCFGDYDNHSTAAAWHDNDFVLWTILPERRTIYFKNSFNLQIAIHDKEPFNNYVNRILSFF